MLSCNSYVPGQIGKYTVLSLLGQGAFATVVKAIDLKTKQFYAIKIISRKEMNNSSTIEYVERELRLISCLDHPNIIKIFDIIYEEDKICIVMEYLAGGDLNSVLTMGVSFNLNKKLQIASALVDALCYLHKNGIAHRDIKPANVLFDENLNPKLIDFGLAIEKANNSSTMCGTVVFMAPEVIKSNNYDGFKSDIWSLGVTLHLLASNQYPFPPMSDSKFINLVRQDKLPVYIRSLDYLGFIIQACLTIDPEQRLSAQELRERIDQSNVNFIEINNHQICSCTTSNLPRLTSDPRFCHKSNKKNLEIRKISSNVRVLGFPRRISA